MSSLPKTDKTLCYCHDDTGRTDYHGVSGSEVWGDTSGVEYNVELCLTRRLAFKLKAFIK